MTVKQLRQMAKGLNIKYGGLRKEELVREIQKAQGNFDCFGTAIGNCDQTQCLFREDCLK
jgi:hypothetical protein